MIFDKLIRLDKIYKICILKLSKNTETPFLFWHRTTSIEIFLAQYSKQLIYLFFQEFKICVLKLSLTFYL